MAAELYLVETVHVDLKGPERLDKLLDYLEPDHVSVEYDLQRAQQANVFQLAIQNPAFFEHIARSFERFFDGSNPETVKKYLEIADFEYFGAKDYCGDNQVRFWLFDNWDPDNHFAELKVPNSEKHKNLVETMSMTPRELQRKVERIYSGELPEAPEEELRKLEQRDKYNARVLRTLQRQVNGRIVHIGGMIHTRGPQHNLYDRLKSLSPRRVKLSEADRL